jgi:SAM-dependent methyltransferase
MIEVVDIIKHYGHGELVARLQAALRDAGMEGQLLSPEQLAPLDQFHSRGIAATVELGQRIRPSPDTKVLDIGSGLGGPSRYLAATYGCHVSGIDLSPSYVDAATFLTERMGLSELVDYSCGDALSLPYGDGDFDVVWTQHAAMNIANRAGLYGEAHRVLRPGGRLAIFDVITANGGPLVYPVPWSRGAETSFLMTAAEMQAMLDQQGFKIRSWTDRSGAALEGYSDLQKQPGASARTALLDQHVVMGPEFKTMAANHARNLAEGRVAIVEAVYVRD